MTNKDLIESLKMSYKYSNIEGNTLISQDLVWELIKVLEERPQGKWFGRHYIRPSTGKYDVHMSVCSECGYEGSYDTETGISVRQTNFCPNCGADMRGGRA